MTLQIQVIRPSSRGMEDILDTRIKEYQSSEVNFFYDSQPEAELESFWAFAGSAEYRAQQFEKALLSADNDAVIAARGGYGASDLLSLIDWTALKSGPKKDFVGFSDMGALNSALLAKSGRPSIHGPMPATGLWNKNSKKDIDTLLGILANTTSEVSVNVTPYKMNNPIEGWLFGGCLSVLTNLIGTEYFPPTLEGAILFLEDTGENPHQIMRHWNQWVQSGVLKGVKALLLGSFSDLGEGIKDTNQEIPKEFFSRSPLPIWTTSEVGHVSPNMPLGIGYNAQIKDKTLTWYKSETKGNLHGIS